jgi:hypothetical protein
MQSMARKKISAAIVVFTVFSCGFLVVQTIYAGNSVTSTVTVSISTPVITGVNLNNTLNGTNPAAFTLTSNGTTTINVNATISDNNGCAELTGGTTTILLYRSGVTSSSCLTNSGNGVSVNLNCYTATAFTASSTCASGSQNTTTTFPVQYFAQATDGSSPYPSQNWMATVIFKSVDNTTGTTDSTSASTTNDFATLTALNVTTSSINYGTLQASSTTGAVNQVATTTNAGNSSSTLSLSASVTLSNGSNVIPTSSQAYSTSTFTYPGTSTALTGSPVVVPGFLLTAPTTTTNVAQPTFWGLSVPNATPTGTYNGTNQFTASFTN